jgi:hypothetical protein
VRSGLLFFNTEFVTGCAHQRNLSHFLGTMPPGERRTGFKPVTLGLGSLPRCANARRAEIRRARH